ncbi:DEAD-domain-containing protein [Sistotremastrum niveocremeum HHB9708]|uniref:ATP-dependent RNA helicase n=1 Tax=Sistotremastrum niveocremeum HHB9708 TaxID=1314777 RepID=A0A164YTL0_9AGAM|nr:DEAD-domain-containing protein [Sistotremastrum niveocremeum HHB9708]
MNSALRLRLRLLGYAVPPGSCKRMQRWPLARSLSSSPFLAAKPTRPLASPSVSRTSISSQRWASTATATKPQDEPTHEAAVQPEVQGASKAGGPTFDSLKDAVHPLTLKALTIKPFQHKHMTPVQAEVLSLMPELSHPYHPDTVASRPPRDLLVKAKTGTGKTVAFLVPAIEARLSLIEQKAKQAVADAGLKSDPALEARIRRSYPRQHCGTLIISPTRELATQIANEALRVAYHHEGFEVRLFVGGMSKRTQMRDWMRGRRDIVVATPGRLRDLLTSEPDIVNGLKETQTLILDEADTLLDMGFRDDLEAIIDYLPQTPVRQTFLFSATVSPAIRQVARASLDKKHHFIDVTDDSSPVHAHIPQYHTVLPSAADQIPHVLRLLIHDQLTNAGKSKTILFLPTTKLTQLYASVLREVSRSFLPAGRQTHVYEIHSKRTQEARTNTSDTFRRDTSGAAILVTSDVSARGVDYPGVTRVIQVGIPSSTEQYIHRVGRTGRAGGSGRGDLVLLPWEVGFLTWKLSDVPLKPVTTSELNAQVTALSRKYDTDGPKAFFKDGTSGSSRRSGSGPITNYNGPLLPLAEELDAKVKQFLPSLDSEAVRETFASLLGYYISKTPEMRTTKDVILQGCRDYSTEGLGLPEPPYVSDDFLQRIGYSDGRTKRWGASRNSRDFSGPRPSSPWLQRGRMDRRSDDSREFSRSDDRSFGGSSDEYRTSRYDKPAFKGRDSYEREPRRQESFGPRSGFTDGGFVKRRSFDRRDSR